ncbi:hypothetical protein ABT57_00450 [Photobacterium ganghwense]|uniref:histidine kinase n=1 Tax=Photobacterium ganghwense TaxID=320778 RepID=A0A0J1HI35_9GAMM|nr:two-component regulator propeller domain-containing protein [Photobacterium ganghwense]KLV11269.1 hypothetical protein ABT57_00450 [Photobacterium ganghwense]QSV14919.1 helix-turn-helix domain-containing protein [Photobacterium ganghwense]
MVVAKKVLNGSQSGLWLIDITQALYYYDGRSLKPAKDRQGNAITGVTDAALLADKLWLVKEGSAYYYEPSTAKLSKLNLSQIPVEAVATTSKNVWFANRRGLYQLSEPQTPPAFTPFAHPLRLTGIHVAGDALYVAAQQGVYEYADSLRPATLLMPEQTVTAVFMDDDKQLWFGTYEGLFKGRDGKPVTLPSEERRQSTTAVTAISQTQQGLWVGTKQGLYLLDRSKLTARRYTASVQEDFMLPGNRILNLHRDPLGALWIATDRGIRFLPQAAGLVKRLRLGDGKGLLPATEVNDIAFTSDGSYWLATDNGLIEVSLFFDILRHHKGLGAVQKLDSYRHNLWLLTASGVYQYSRLRHHWLPLALPPGLNHESLTTLMVDHYGSLWLAAGSRLYRYWPDSAEWMEFGEHWLKDPLGQEKITSLYADSEHQIWVGTDYGLYQFESGHLYLVSDTEKLGGVRDIYEDRLGQLWVANRYGLQYSQTLTPLALQLVPIVGSRAYPYCVVGDSNGVWVSSSQGLSHLSFEAQLIRHLSQSDGVLPQEFSAPVCLRSSAGNLLFATREGLLTFTPNTLLAHEQLPEQLTLSEVRADNQLYQMGGTSDEPLQLPYGAAISFEFTITPWQQQTNFFYRIRSEDGEDSAWQSVSSPNVFLDHLSPGHFVLEASLSSPESALGGHKVLRLDFDVERPWYLSTGITLLVMAGVVSLVAAALYWRNVLNNQQNMQLKQAVFKKTARIELQKKQINASNMQLQRILEVRQNMMAQLSHELRTPLSLSLSLLEGVKPQGSEQGKLAIIEKNLAHALHVAEQLLSKDALALAEPDKLCEQWVSPVVQASCMSWQVEAEKKQIALCLEDESAGCSVFLAPYHLEIILGNLLSNALKYTDRNGGITVTVKERQQQLVISVSDTGKGMSAETKAHLFESYYQEEPVFSPEAGFGLGLSTVKQLVERYQGDISVISYQGVGSEFIVRLPLYHSAAQHAEPEMASEAETCAAQAPATSKPAVLLACAETPMIAWWQSLLSEEYRVTCVRDGYEALIAMLENTPDLLVASATLPGLAGVPLLQRLAEELPDGYEPRILLVDDSGSLDSTDILLSGWAHELITWPADNRDVRARLNKLMHPKEDSSTDDKAVPTPDQLWCDNVRVLIATHYHDPQFSTSIAAKALFLSERSLQRKFRQKFGLAFKDYVTQYRIEQAMSHLEQGEPLSEVARSCGFQDVEVFIARFRAATGREPEEILADCPV